MLFYAMAESTGSPVLDSFLPFINLGVLVVVVGMVLTRRGFIPSWSLQDCETSRDRELAETRAQYDRAVAFLQAQMDRVEAERRDLRHQLDTLQRTTTEQVVPVLIEANRITSQYLDTLSRQQSRLL
jgi:hypothetical protein